MLFNTLERVRNFMKRIIFVLNVTLLFAALPFSAAHAIKKCQDSEGRWHYGDVAVSQCQQSKVTTLNDRGFVESEKEAPKTPEQLEKERQGSDLAEAKAARIQAEENERNRILSIYETEADIDRQRDNQIGSVESNIAVHKAYTKSLNGKIERLKVKSADFSEARKKTYFDRISEAEARIKESEIELEALTKQKIAIIEKFDREKKIYLELTNQS